MYSRFCLLSSFKLLYAVSLFINILGFVKHLLLRRD